MKLSDFLYECAEYVEKNGFSPKFDRADIGKPNCGCFWHATNIISQRHYESGIRLRDKADNAVQAVLGMDYLYVADLLRAGWAEGKTKDAGAAFRIAGDIEAARGR